jgi:ribosomal protein S18 acetylase RimI-like enzyme
MLEPVFRAGDTYAVDPDISRDAALAYWCAPGKSTFLAETDRPVGSYFLVRNAGGGGSHVCNCGFVTHPDARGQGVAQAMLDHALATARAQGFAAMQFNFVVATNTGAIRLWTRAGFEIIGALLKAFRHPQQGLVDALVMFKTL